MTKIKPPILIVDDNEVDRYILKRLIKEAKLELTIFEKKDGQEALEFLENYEANRKEYPDGFPPILGSLYAPAHPILSYVTKSFKVYPVPEP